ncbi:hypothetical protein ACFZB5_30210 [Streptomyces nodosus]|uniref:hypothetical protein n=1 Tax=Streptomyces nodosus TaxID=40318 RepID=UPI0036E00103
MTTDSPMPSPPFPSPDEEDEGDEPFRAYGKSKDHRDDLPQITIGLAVTKEGVPVRCWVRPGGTNDQTTPPQVKDDMRDWRLGRVITVVDRGFSSAVVVDSLAYEQKCFTRGQRSLRPVLEDCDRGGNCSAVFCE